MQDSGAVPVEVGSGQEGFWDGFEREQSARQEEVGALGSVLCQEDPPPCIPFPCLPHHRPQGVMSPKAPNKMQRHHPGSRGHFVTLTILNISRGWG